MTPSSRVGRSVALSTTFSFTLILSAMSVESAYAASARAGGFQNSAVSKPYSGNHVPWIGARADRVNQVSGQLRPTRLGPPTPNHQLVASHRHHSRVLLPSYIAPNVVAPVQPAVNVVSAPSSVVTQSPPVVYYQQACASPLIIRIEPTGSDDRRHHGGRGRSGRDTNRDAQLLYGASDPCGPQIATVRQRDLQSARSVSTRY